MIKINLLPREARKRVGIGEQIAVIVLVLVATVVGIGMYWRYLDGVIEQKEADIVKTQERLDELQKVIDEIKAFEQQRAALEQKLEIIATLEKEQQMPVHLLDELYQTLEEDMWLQSVGQNQSLASTEANVNIQATALSNPVVSNYLRNLQNSPYFQNVELLFSQGTRIGNREVRNFQVQARLSVEKGLAADMLKLMASGDLITVDESLLTSAGPLKNFLVPMLEAIQELEESGELETLIEADISAEERQAQFDQLLKNYVSNYVSEQEFATFEQVYTPGMVELTP
jgi:type IV pilus assembly protein PilN